MSAPAPSSLTRSQPGSSIRTSGGRREDSPAWRIDRGPLPSHQEYCCYDRRHRSSPVVVDATPGIHRCRRTRFSAADDGSEPLARRAQATTITGSLLQRSLPELKRWAHGGGLPAHARGCSTPPTWGPGTACTSCGVSIEFEPRQVHSMRSSSRRAVINRIQDDCVASDASHRRGTGRRSRCADQLSALELTIQSRGLRSLSHRHRHAQPEGPAVDRRANRTAVELQRGGAHARAPNPRRCPRRDLPRASSSGSGMFGPRLNDSAERHAE